MMLADAGSAHTIRWVQSLAARGHEVRLFTLTPPEGDSLAKLAGVSVSFQGITNDLARSSEGALGKLRYLRVLPALRAEIREWRPDLVHAHYASSYGLLGMLAGARPRIVSVWGMDVYSFPERSWLHKAIVRAVLRSADVVLSTSYVMRERALRLVDRRVEVTPFGVDTDRFRPLARTHDRDELRVGIVKTLESKYGVEYLLRAFSIVRRAGLHPTSYRLVIVGGGSLRPNLERLVAELGLEGCVRFVGPCAYDEVHVWHQSFDLAVYPSVDPSESFGVAVIESQSCGVPVVVSEIGGLPEVVVDQETGFVVPARDPQSLASAMLKLLDDRVTRARCAEAARRHVVGKYSLESCTDVMEQVYRTVTSGKANHRPEPRRNGVCS